MPDFLPVRMQDKLHGRQSDLRERESVIWSSEHSGGAFIVPLAVFPEKISGRRQDGQKTGKANTPAADVLAGVCVLSVLCALCHCPWHLPQAPRASGRAELREIRGSEQLPHFDHNRTARKSQ